MATIIDTSTTPSNCGNPSGSNYHHFNMVLSAHIAIKLSASNFILGQLLVAFLIAYVNERERVGFSSCDTACQIWKPIEVKYANLSRTHLMSLKNCREVIRALKMSYSTSLFLSKIETLQLSIKPSTANCDFNFQDITKYWFQSPCCLDSVTIEDGSGLVRTERTGSTHLCTPYTYLAVNNALCIQSKP
ncbi:transmembrane protein, putative [Medicago truncatula]|uniref:Transmembrane protein, putative n=1 Tax=Medicago truncatula TaxID=3880 RepID=G7K4A4_MEDTR|nr:transmembrane protein, putative [Medicago truncatula]